MCAGLTGEPLEKCLKTWASCVKKAFKAQNGKVCIRMYILLIIDEATTLQCAKC